MGICPQNKRGTVERRVKRKVSDHVCVDGGIYTSPENRRERQENTAIRGTLCHFVPISFHIDFNLMQLYLTSRSMSFDWLIVLPALD